MTATRKLTEAQRFTLLETLEKRFADNPDRHKNLSWSDVKRSVSDNDDALRALYEMEASGGEPDVVSEAQGVDIVFYDCSAESPVGRRNLCYDREAWESRKKNKPSGNAVETAISMGVELLTEERYRHLQTLGEFDMKSSSWIITPDGIRELGGALFADRRYDHVFVYHNGAESYYAVRGFRARLHIA